MTALREEIGTDEILSALAALTAKVDALQSAGPGHYTVAQVAEMHGVSTKTIHRRMNAGELPFVRKYGQKMVKREDV